MITLKTDTQIESMKEGGHILATVLMETMERVVPGTTELEIDAYAEKRIRELGGEPGFKRVAGYRNTICMAVNDVVVHGIPTTYAFKPGDMVCVDMGVYYDGLHTDMAETKIVQNSEFRIQNKNEETKFLEIGKRALNEAFKEARPGNRIGHISRRIQQIVEEQGGYSVVRNLVGHGVGKELHEEPEVPGVLFDKIEKTPLLQPGLTIAIEIIYNMGGPDVVYKGSDGWTIATADGSLSAVFERSIVITKDGYELLTI